MDCVSVYLNRSHRSTNVSIQVDSIVTPSYLRQVKPSWLRRRRLGVRKRRLTWIHGVLCRFIERSNLCSYSQRAFDMDFLLIFLSLKGLSEVSY